MKIIIFFVMNAFLIKENRDFPLIKDYHSNLQSSLSYFIFFPSFCSIWSSCNKEKNKPPFFMQKMSLKLRVNLLLNGGRGGIKMAAASTPSVKEPARTSF